MAPPLHLSQQFFKFNTQSSCKKNPIQYIMIRTDALSFLIDDTNRVSPVGIPDHHIPSCSCPSKRPVSLFPDRVHDIRYVHSWSHIGAPIWHILELVVYVFIFRFSLAICLTWRVIQSCNFIHNERNNP